MEVFSKIPHQLKRDGLSQLDRQNEALSPSSIEIDDRGTKDFLEFLYQYARQINYYEEKKEGNNKGSEQRSGDWVPFFRKSIPFQYAVIASYDLTTLDSRFTKVDKAIRSRLSFESLNLLFDLLFDISDQLTQWLLDTQQDNSGLRLGIENLIETSLSAQFLRLIQLANAAGKWGYKRSKNSDQIKEYWGLNPMKLYRVDRSILTLKGSIKHKVTTAHNMLVELYRTFWKAVQTIISIANDEKKLEDSLTNNNEKNHEPHLGLMFAFLRLFKDAQGGLNQLSTTHLDFFYKKTLQLTTQSIVPDQAHVSFELAKKIEEDILLEKGSRFKAGKDDKGQDVFYALEEEVIITKTKVADLRTLFLDREGTGTYTENVHQVEGIYIAPVANSANGKGEAFPKGPQPRWATIGAKQSKWLNPDEMMYDDHPQARIGFMLASKILLLREGKRALTITLTLKEPMTKAIDASYFKYYVSTEEGWHPLVDNIENLSFSVANDDAKKLIFKGTLLPDFPAVIATDSEVLGTNYGHALPMIKFELYQNGTDADAAHCYAELRSHMVCEVNIDVTVCDVRQLVIQNDLALLDVNKPFMPFGPIPKKNSSNFYIGSDEIFCKRWEAIEINPNWKDQPDEFNTYYAAYPSPPSEDSFTASVDFLAQKDWKTHDSIQLFEPSSSNPLTCSNTSIYWLVNRKADEEICKDLSGLENGYQTDTPCGFLRIKLGTQDFLHTEYSNTIIRTTQNLVQIPELEQLIDALEIKTDSLLSAANTSNNAVANLNTGSSSSTISSAKTKSTTARQLALESETEVDAIYNKIHAITNTSGQVPLPNAPYTPLIESLSINYKAVANSKNDSEIIFTHLHPFKGTYESKKVDTTNCQLETYDTSVLPCFVDEGTLFVGLENYQPGSNLNLYFEMEPASADPDVDKAIVCWEYLRNNLWKPLEIDTHVLSDTTNGLIQSGIINFTIPANISSEKTTIMPAHLHWLKARVLFRTAAISESLAVQSQSALVTFSPASENDLNRLASPLPAMQIAKFDVPVAAIKGVQQPYAGFGGRPEELASSFYQRISEHLRHKGRAISIYDYERIILQQFETIYKVKCISHTLGRRGQHSDIELAPGFVTIVVLPDLSKINAVHPLQPKVPAATLESVKKLLQQKRSPFIKLEVLNPIFETIAVQAKVKFRPGKSNPFYTKQLEEEVTAFLAPWAFSETRQDISFGGKIYYSTILKFIEDREYVDFLIDFTMQDQTGQFKDVIQASNSRVVLTSGMHSFTALEPNDPVIIINDSQKAGIGLSKIPKV